ncbi:hypothetical protein [Thermococcus sp. MV5]|uniref:hypothetical protein n=1 Tax=Thermococcus sp. MV5 TaxID=1638272 RepID=UPI001981BC48|nr:hypothetical protein [Thermococcus sp. MV5]
MKELGVRGSYSTWKFKEKRGDVWNISSRTKEETYNINKRFAIGKVKLSKVLGVFSLNKNRLENTLIREEFSIWVNIGGV